MTKKEVKKFLDTHRDIGISAAKAQYGEFIYPEIEDAVFNDLKKGNVSMENQEITAMISNAKDSEQLVALMRKTMPGLNEHELRKKLLANEELVMTAIKEKALTNRQDRFIENALYFFLRCKENVSDWIVANYESFKSEYLKSVFCLVLGFRGGKELIPFLISEAERFEKYYPDKTYDQGPALAVQELACRFLN